MNEMATNGYPVSLAPDGDSVMATFPDFPEAATFGEDEDEALARSVEAIQTAIMGRMADKEDIPAPSRVRKGQHAVALPTLVVAKIALYRVMREEGMRKADLSRLMNTDFSQISRLFDLNHQSHIGQIDSALALFGKQLVVGLK